MCSPTRETLSFTLAEEENSMSLKQVSSNCWQSLRSRINFYPSKQVLSSTWSSHSDGQQQQRSFAKAAAAVAGGKKTATPNAAKASKAKTSIKKEEKKEQRERFNDLINACLKAPSPFKVTSGEDLKQQLRVLEKETMTSISPAIVEEIVLEKARAKAAKATALAAKAASMKTKKGNDGKTVLHGEDEARVGEAVSEIAAEAETSLLVIEPVDQLSELELHKQQLEPSIQLTAEELAKESSRVLLAEHRDREKSESIRLQMQKDAIAALPSHLREAALLPDLTPFPKTRIPASLTPPIRGYIDARTSAAQHAVKSRKSR